MRYKAKNIDTDKAEKYLRKCINDCIIKENSERKALTKYYEGYREGIEQAIDIFYCSNYEKEESEDKE